MGPGESKKGNGKPETSYLSPEVANWLATRAGWTTKDTAKATGASESEAKAAEQAAENDAKNEKN